MYVKVKDHNKAEETFYEISQPSATAYRNLIHNYKVEIRPDKATRALKTLLNETRYRIDPSLPMFHAVLESWLQVDVMTRDTFVVWDWLKHSAKTQMMGLKPDMTTLSLLVRLHLRNCMSASNILDEMKHHFNVKPNRATLLLVLESLFVNKETLDFTRAENLIDQLDKVHPTVYERIVRSYPATIEYAHFALAEFEGRESSVHSFNIMLAIFSKTFQNDRNARAVAYDFYHRHRSRFPARLTSWKHLSDMKIPIPFDGEESTMTA